MRRRFRAAALLRAVFVPVAPALAAPPLAEELRVLHAMLVERAPSNPAGWILQDTRGGGP